MTDTQNIYLALLRYALWDKTPIIQHTIDWNELMHLCHIHGTEPLVYAKVLKLASKGWLNANVIKRDARGRVIETNVLSDEVKQYMKSVCVSNMMHQQQQMALLKKTWDALTPTITPVLLKGFGLADLYADAYLRSWGDLDIYVGPDQYHEAAAILRDTFPHAKHHDEEWEELKHYCLVMPEGVIEMHRSTVKMDHPRDRRIYDKLEHKAMQANMIKELSLHDGSANGYSVNLPAPWFNLLFTFIHAWYHFVEEGVGMKQLCDLCLLAVRTKSCFVSSDDEEKQYEHYIESNLKRLHLWQPWQLVGYFCINHLDLSESAWPAYIGAPVGTRRYKAFVDYVLNEGQTRAQDHSESKNRYEAREKALKMNVIARKMLTLRQRMAVVRFVRPFSPDYARHLKWAVIRKGIRRTLKGEKMEVMY